MILKSIKDRLYYYFAEKNWGVYREYGPYVDSHWEEHLTHRWKHWWLLLRLNIHYRVLRREDRLIPVDIPAVNKAAAKPGPKPEAAPTAKPGPKPEAAPTAKPGPKPGAAPAAKPGPKPGAAPAAKPGPKPGAAPAAPRIYPDGAESGKGKRGTPYHYAVPLLNYDAISFDIFDTLILRHLNQPKDVFMLVGQSLGIYNYPEIRERAEKESRDEQIVLHGFREVTIDEIYEKVAFYTGIDKQQGIETEFQIELDMCMANPFMLEVFEILKAAGKLIYITSNMYYPRDRMEKLLAKCGYTGYCDLLVSCDYRCAKTDGELFLYLKQMVGQNKKIIHIGDNRSTDIRGAQKVGITAKLYPACREFGEPHRPRGMSPLIAGAYQGIINNTLHNGLEQFSQFQEYGFCFGGLMALGYVQWIHKKAKEDGAQVIYFIARDGFILKKIYDSLFQDIPSKYLYWSRLTALRSLQDGERYHFLKRFFEELCNTGDTLHDVLELAGLTELAPVFEKNGMPVDRIYTTARKKQIEQIIVENWPMVEHALAGQNRAMSNYLDKITAGVDRAVLVDVGWTGQSLYPLAKYMRANGMNQVDIYLLGSRTRNQGISLIMDRNVSCYMFNIQENRMAYDSFMKGATYSIEMVEKLFSAPHPSLLCFEPDGSMSFCPPESRNYFAFKEMQEGILMFVTRYVEAFKNYPFLMDISGYDAYVSMRQVFSPSSENYMRKLFRPLTYSQGISPYHVKQITTLIGGAKK